MPPKCQVLEPHPPYVTVSYFFHNTPSPDHDTRQTFSVIKNLKK